jgi:hypothetical protein
VQITHFLIGNWKKSRRKDPIEIFTHARLVERKKSHRNGPICKNSVDEI